MSRIGRMPIAIPAGVDVVQDGSKISAKGPKGSLMVDIHPAITAEITDGVINITRPDDSVQKKALHGLTRALVANMIHGVHEGFSKELEIQGVGYRAQKQGTQLVMNLGYSHQVIVDEIPGITIEVPAPNRVIIRGIDRQAVGQFAANVRGKRTPNAYDGKGVRYAGEKIVLKPGKAGGKKK